MKKGKSNMKRDVVYNPVTHVLKTIELFKMFRSGLQTQTGIVFWIKQVVCAG